jgi:hypothetical protein
MRSNHLSGKKKVVGRMQEVFVNDERITERHDERWHGKSNPTHPNGAAQLDHPT